MSEREESKKSTELDLADTVPGFSESDSGESNGGEDALTGRRTAVKKAIAAAGVAGAVWVAPRVEGLSIIPDFASAATLTSNITVTVVSPNSNNFSYIWAGPGDYWALAPGPSSSTSTKNQALAVNANVPAMPGATTSVTLNQGTLADQNAGLNGFISFSGWDPPFNRFTGGNMEFQVRNVGTTFVVPLASIGPAPTQSPLPFSIPEAANNVGASPAPSAEWQQLLFKLNFGFA